MSVKTVFIVAAQMLILQSISVACIGMFGPFDGFGRGRFGYEGYGYDGFGYGAPIAGACGFGPAGLAASNGPGLAVTSISPLIPVGVSVLSENAYGGDLCVGGAAPFLGTVALEGALPTAGSGAVTYGCGNGAVAITAEEAPEYGYAVVEEPEYGYGLGGRLGYGAGCAGIAEPFGYGIARPCGSRAGFGYRPFF